MSATKIKITWATGSVSTSSTLRYYIPVRAADSIRVRSDIQNVDKTMIVVGVEYREANGGVSTRYEVVEDSTLQSAEFSGSTVSGLTDSVNTEDELPEEPEFAANPSVQTTCVFSSSSASQVDWAAGNIYVGNEVFAIEAGDSSYLSALNSDGRIYYVYYIKGETKFRVIDDADYAALVQERNDSNFKIIAEINYDLPFAVWRLVGIQGGFAQSSSPTTIPNAARYYADDGSASVPSFSFAADTDTGFFRNGFPFIGGAVAGSNVFQLSAAGIQTVYQTTTGTNLIATSGNSIAKDSSSKRYKKNIVETALDSNKVYDLEPVDFEWNETSATPGKKGFGLIAEEVAKVYPEIVHYNNDGTVESVAYDRLSLLLLIEIKKLKEETEKLKENN